ncbi:K(lysine) acetyltransferase [Mortierella sp. GBA30]|nr:K(lysine) acetyltransferase [Mortierella sp. GBA30]
MTARKDKETAIEIGGFYAIIGKDGRESDKRLDEWVDIQRLMPLKTPEENENTASSGTGVLQGHRKETDASSVTTRPKRKAVKDDIAESLISPPPKAWQILNLTGVVVLEGAVIHPRGRPRQDPHDEEVPQVRNVEWILYAGYDIATWYYSPFPEEYEECPRLFICEYCLKYIRQVESFITHNSSCKRKKPPGMVVYSKGANKIYKVDGGINKLYCQNLSLLAKLFLDNKTLYFDVHGFQFFVLTETRSSDRADVPVGFFSKEIVSYDGYNLACILVLPPFQRKSYGKMLIEFSYELTKIEGKVGSPEKPLSDLGKLGYVSYWITAILRELYPKPWPAKRVILPPSNRRKSRATSIKSTSASETAPVHLQARVAASDATATTKEGLRLPEVKTEIKGLGPMDVDPPAILETIAEAPRSVSSNSGSDNREIAFSIRELAARTGVMEEDLLETLVIMGWMAHWQTPLDQALTPAVKEAKRNYRKLMKFHEQQQLLEKYGGVHDSSGSTATGVNLEGRDYESGSGRLHHSQARLHTRQLSNSQVGHEGKSPSPRSPSSQLPQTFQLGLGEDFNPVAILDIPESDNDHGDEDGVLDASALSSSPGLKDVAVVTMEMVKDYQDRHNIRLDPYLDWNAIDWAAYHSTFDQ